MRSLFIPAKSKVPLEIPDAILRKLPNRIALVSTIQYAHALDPVRARLRELGIKVHDLHGSHSKHANQVLGCNTFPAEQLQEIDAIFYIGTGVFHPKALALRAGKPVHMYHPLTRSYELLEQAEADRIRRRERAALGRFLTATRIGVLFTTKPGQYPIQIHLKQMQQLEKKYPEKEFYLIIDNTLDYGQLENFPYIEVFVNTACPNIAYDQGLPRLTVNMEQVLALP